MLSYAAMDEDLSRRFGQAEHQRASGLFLIKNEAIERYINGRTTGIHNGGRSLKVRRRDDPNHIYRFVRLIALAIVRIDQLGPIQVQIINPRFLKRFDEVVAE